MRSLGTTTREIQHTARNPQCSAPSRPQKWIWSMIWKNNWEDCRGTFSFKGSNMLFLSFVCCFSRILYSLSVPGKQEWEELHAVLRTEIMREGTCLDSFQWLLTMTLLKCNLFSYAPRTQDSECFLALWRLLFAWLCFCSLFFFLLPKAAIYEDIWTGVSANKAPLFHLRLGSPASLFSLTPVPRSWSTKTMTEDVLKDWMWKMRGQRLRMTSNLGDGWGWYSLIWQILN